jgi:hypothetical protein
MAFFEAIFFGPKLLAGAYPAAPFVLAALFILVQVVLTMRDGGSFGSGFFRMPPTFAGVLWAIYGLYEPQVRAAFPNAGLRIDLLVLVPILYVFTGVAVWSIWTQWRKKAQK